MVKSWDELPTKGQIKERIDAFLRAFRDGDFDRAFQECPPLVYEKDKGSVLRLKLDRSELAEHLSHAMFQFIDGQSVLDEEKARQADAKKPETWCSFITPPKDLDYVDLNLDLRGLEEDSPDDTRAEKEGEVLANVHLNGEVTDITGRYDLMKHEEKWILAFSNFDIM